MSLWFPHTGVLYWDARHESVREGLRWMDDVFDIQYKLHAAEKAARQSSGHLQQRLPLCCGIWQVGAQIQILQYTHIQHQTKFHHNTFFKYTLIFCVCPSAQRRFWTGTTRCGTLLRESLCALPPPKHPPLLLLSLALLLWGGPIGGAW